MVPHSLSIANSKSDEKLKSADIFTEDRQFLGKLAWLSRIRHHPLNASQKHRLHTIARLWLQYKHLPTTCAMNTVTLIADHWEASRAGARRFLSLGQCSPSASLLLA